MLLEPLVAHPFDIGFGHDPGRAADHGGVDREEVGPGGVEHEAQAMGIEDLDGLHLLVEQRGEDSLVADEAIVHVFRGERIAIVKGHPLAQGEVIGQPIRAFRPGCRQGGGQGIAPARA